MPRSRVSARPDLYDQVTQTIVAQLAAGVRPWTRPWSAGGVVRRPSRVTGEPYRGVNVLMLWAGALQRGFQDPMWMTFRQALALGGHVRKGERGVTVVYADRVVRREAGDADADPPRSFPFLKAYVVFNREQVADLPPRLDPAPPTPLDPGCRIASADAFVTATGAQVRHGGDRACYAPQADQVQMPPFDAFADADAYYATLAHECVHWTGHEQRLARTFGARFGDAAYACEELVAELGAAFLCADLGLALTPREDHAAYLGPWLKVLRQDKRAIFVAATAAQRACDYLHSLQPAPEIPGSPP